MTTETMHKIAARLTNEAGMKATVEYPGYILAVTVDNGTYVIGDANETIGMSILDETGWDENPLPSSSIPSDTDDVEAVVGYALKQIMDETVEVAK